MVKAIIWGVGRSYNQYINAIRYQVLLGEIQVVGVTGRDDIYDYLDGYPFIPIGHLNKIDFEYIIVAAEAHYEEVVKTAVQMGFSNDKIMAGGIFLYPNFSFQRYIELCRQRVSVIANNCWGGLIYHTLKSEFLSPFINMFLEDEDYIQLLGNLSYYLNCCLKFDRYAKEPVLKSDYPVCKLDDIELHFNHYKNMDEVEQKWYSRCKRINWDNLFVMMYTEKEESARRFSGLGFPKMVCFVPFESHLKSVHTLRLACLPQMKEVPFWMIVNGIAQMIYNDYDLVELLATGEIKNRGQKGWEASPSWKSAG